MTLRERLTAMESRKKEITRALSNEAVGQTSEFRLRRELDQIRVDIEDATDAVRRFNTETRELIEAEGAKLRAALLPHWRLIAGEAFEHYLALHRIGSKAREVGRAADQLGVGYMPEIWLGQFIPFDLNDSESTLSRRLREWIENGLIDEGKVRRAA